MIDLIERALNVVRKWLRDFRRSEPLDMALVHKMRLQGLSWREIAARLPGKPPHNTVFVAHQKWERAHPAPVPASATVVAPEPVRQAPVLTAKYSEPIKPPVIVPDRLEAELGSLRAPAPAAKPPAIIPEPVQITTVESEPEPEVDTSAVYGLDSVQPGTQALFLVHGSLNQQYARGCAQPCVGVERWDAAYWRLPAFQAVERVWIVLNEREDNRNFLLSIAADARLRDKSLIAPVRRGNTVQAICKSRLLARRDEGHAYRDDWHFEAVQGFVRLSSVRDLQQFLPVPEQREPFEMPPPRWEIPGAQWWERQ